MVGPVTDPPNSKPGAKELGLKLQRRFGIKHIQQVSEWERGDVRPGSKHLVGLAKVLQVDVAALLSNL